MQKERRETLKERQKERREGQKERREGQKERREGRVVARCPQVEVWNRCWTWIRGRGSAHPTAQTTTALLEGRKEPEQRKGGGFRAGRGGYGCCTASGSLCVCV